MKNNIEFYIPFEGFYNSIYDGLIDDLINRDIEEGYITIKQSENINYNLLFNGMSEHIFDNIIELFNDEICAELNSCNIIYDGLHSPKYYNYSTDKIKAIISQDTYNLILKATRDNDDIINYINESIKSCDGFASFYDGYESVVSEPQIYLEYLFQWFTLSEYRDEVIDKTCDNICEVIYNNLEY